jgi:Ras-related protein Rab-7A
MRIFVLMRYTDLQLAVIARNALAQEESEEFSGDFSDPINIHIENDRDGCAC